MPGAVGEQRQTRVCFGTRCASSVFYAPEEFGQWLVSAFHSENDEAFLSAACMPQQRIGQDSRSKGPI